MRALPKLVNEIPGPIGLPPRPSMPVEVYRVTSKELPGLTNYKFTKFRWEPLSKNGHAEAQY